jgi:hypothetical protein
MKKTISLIAATLMTVLTAQAALAGNCDHDWQTASDGSRCGDRSADSRPGGN